MTVILPLSSRLPEELSPVWARLEFGSILPLLVSYTLGKAGVTMSLLT